MGQETGPGFAEPGPQAPPPPLVVVDAALWLEPGLPPPDAVVPPGAPSPEHPVGAARLPAKRAAANEKKRVLWRSILLCNQRTPIACRRHQGSDIMRGCDADPCSSVRSSSSAAARRRPN